MKKYLYIPLVVLLFLFLWMPNTNSRAQDCTSTDRKVAQLKVQLTEINKRHTQINSELVAMHRYLNRPPSRGGYRRFVATGYTYTGNNTSSGTWPKPGYTVAVDPSIIPKGSRVLIRSDYPGVNGIRYAEDTGGDIVGFRVDVFFATREEAVQFGRRAVEIIILPQEVSLSDGEPR